MWESIAELDEISLVQGRFQALITYIMFKKILVRAPTILYRLEFITVGESVGKRCKPSHGGTYNFPFSWIEEEVACVALFFLAPTTIIAQLFGQILADIISTNLCRILPPVLFLASKSLITSHKLSNR